MMLTLLLQAYYAAIIACVLAFPFAGIGSGVAVFSLLAGWIFARRHAAALLAAHPDGACAVFHDGESEISKGSLWSSILYIAVRHFLWMLYPVDHSLNTLSPNNFGDLPLHINFIRSFSIGVPFPPKNPIFASELLRYPYGADLYNALWDVLGVRLEAHLFAVGVVATAVSLALLRSFWRLVCDRRILLKRRPGRLAGSVGAPLQDFQAAVSWKNLFLSVFITQRGMLFALPIRTSSDDRLAVGTSMAAPASRAGNCGFWG